MTSFGLFVSHLRTERVRRHFDRLVRETAGLVDWRFAFNSGLQPDLQAGFPYQPATNVMPARHEQMSQDTGARGFMDLMLMPCALGAARDFVWMVEYDVDFAGNWATLFSQFEDSSADLLTTTLTQRHDRPDWAHWRNAVAPETTPADAYCRCFHPIMRVSHHFASEYCSRFRRPGWSGHSEFTIATIAVSGGFSVEDLGGTGAFTPPLRRGLNYTNTPAALGLAPGSFLWRPSKAAYFHEDPATFPQPNLLYHPVKPDVDDWELGFQASPAKT